MTREFLAAVERAVAHLVADFQGQTTRFWNERDIHWYLFHHLKKDSVFQRDYGTEPIRAEFPTRTVYSERKVAARGHYDLVILDPASLTNSPASELPPWASWEDYLRLVDVLVAVEVKTWVQRTTDIGKKVDWDIEKLTDPRNAVRHSYFLNFVQLDFTRQQMRDFYRDLKGYLATKSGYSELKILCIPHDRGMQPHSNENWVD